jgi:hypothetical protein
VPGASTCMMSERSRSNRHPAAPGCRPRRSSDSLVIVCFPADNKLAGGGACDPVYLRTLKRAASALKPARPHDATVRTCRPGLKRRGHLSDARYDRGPILCSFALVGATFEPLTMKYTESEGGARRSLPWGVAA